jgi:5'-nucleotidase/UDP-sugar diphosphatase
MMNQLGYDAMTVGNHEFDDGPEVLRGFVDALNFPILMSNADFSAEPLLAGSLQKSTVISVNGELIGLIGLTPQDTNELSSPGKGVNFTDPSDAVQHQVDALTGASVNIIIVLSHSGYDVDQAVAANTTGVDIIVGGHSNTYLSNTSDRAKGPYPTMVGNTAIVQAYAYSKYLGELNATFDDDGNLLSATGEPITMNSEVVEDAATVARIAEAAEPLIEIRNKVVGTTSTVIEGSREICRVSECEMGNLVADSHLDRVADQGISIAILNGGGIRASIDVGDVTMGDVLTVLPFQNMVSTMQLSGANVIAALENGVSKVEEVAGRFPQVAGVRFTFDTSVAPNEGRVTEVLVANGDNWEPIDPDAMYGVVTNSYMRSGGDGYSVFANESVNAYDYGPNQENVVADYMAAGGAYTPYTDGRITQK